MNSKFPFTTDIAIEITKQGMPVTIITGFLGIDVMKKCVGDRPRIPFNGSGLDGG